MARSDMSTDKEIKELEKRWRQSRKAIPIYTVLFVAAAGIVWVLSRFFAIPLWITLIVLGLTAFTLIGDIINCFHCAWKLRALRNETKD
jgi:fatty acid desaturase